MRATGIVAASLVVSVCLGGCGSSSPKQTVKATSSSVPNTATASGYKLSVFVKAPSATTKPDSIVQLGSNIFIGYQNVGDVKDGSNPNLTNSVVQYDLKANMVKTFTVPGHVDGLLARSDTNQLWAMANEDGNPELTIINLADGTQKSYPPTVNPPLHGGGFDDLQLLFGTVYVSASNPATPGVAPTLVSLALNGNGSTFDVFPVLQGNATAIDFTPSVGGAPNPNYKQAVPLNLTDPDSLAINADGTGLVLDSQADAKLIFIQNPGAAQIVSMLSLTLYNDKDGPSMPVDDTRFVPVPGSTGGLFMLFTDAANTTYRVDASFTQGDAYSCGQGLVMKLDLTSGHLTPVVAGIGVASALQDPHGMLFVVD